MSVVNMAKTIKEVHPDYVILYKVGSFYHCYGKDAYIMAYLFNYFIKNSAGNVPCVGFPKNSISKVQSTLENKKINYLLIDVKNEYDVDEKSENNNLNTYDSVFERAHKYVKIKKRIEKISEALMFDIEKDNIKEKIRKIEEIIDEE